MLGHALAMKAIHGGKAKNDKLDSLQDRESSAGGLLPQAYVYPAAMRATRDLLRRRLHLVRKRGQLLAHIQNTRAQYNLPASAGGSPTRPIARACGAFSRSQCAQEHRVDLTLVAQYDTLITDLELTIVREAKRHDADAFHRLRSVPGIGKVLALTILYEFTTSRASIGSRVCLVRAARESARTVGRQDPRHRGAKMGNVHLKWAFSEAAVLFLRHTKDGKKLLAAIEKKHGRAKRSRSWPTRSGAPSSTCCREGPSSRRRSSSRRRGKGAGEPDA